MRCEDEGRLSRGVFQAADGLQRRYYQFEMAINGTEGLDDGDPTDVLRRVKTSRGVCLERSEYSKYLRLGQFKKAND